MDEPKNPGDIIAGLISPKGGFKYREPFINPNDPATAKIVNKLFLTFQAIFPAFRNAWPTEQEFTQAKREWVKALNQVGLTNIEAIRRGVARFRVLPSPFVPSPGQFIEMCRNANHDGLPTLHEAWSEVKKQIGNEHKDWSHEVIQHAYRETGSWDLKHLTEKDAKTLFARNYEIASRMFHEGQKLAPIQKAITKEFHKNEGTKETALSHLSKIKDMLR